MKKIKILDKILNHSFILGDRQHLVSVYLVEADSNEKVVPGADADMYGNREILGSIWFKKEEAVKMLDWENEKEAVKLSK